MVASALAGSEGLALLLAPTTLYRVTGAVLGVSLAAGYWLFRLLSKHLGRATTVATYSLIGASLLAAAAALTPHCPGQAARCTAQQVAGYALGGALMPLGWIALIGIPLLVITAAVRAVSRAVVRLRELRSGRA